MRTPEYDDYIIFDCPCCGGKSRFVECYNNVRWVWYIKCEECGICTPTTLTKEECQDIWNTRPKKTAKKVSKNEE